MSFRLKSLELNGYKTFASRTVFEFADSITAMIGPNGSGKSNIADALRWVLGEQSYKLLRGRKTDDMIFAGSEMRSKSGMASATVVFDNSDGWLPIDFSEVSITRRAYRDGQNEYLINNQKVRLMDVSELLFNSGLAERTYTVIGQGLVDTILSLKADERRRLFEEAAGIALYRSRKEQSLRRLDKTNRNLERVQDIISELKPRLRSLERQARRTQEYEQVKTDLHEILRDWYGYHWHRTQQQLKESRQLAQMQEAALGKVREEYSNLSQRIDNSRVNVQDLRERLNGWHSKLAELHSIRENVGRDLAVGDERSRSLAEQENNLISEAGKAKEEFSISQTRLNEAAAEEIRLTSLVSEAEEHSVSARSKLTELQENRRDSEIGIKASRDLLAELNSQKIGLDTRRVELESQLERYQLKEINFVNSIEEAKKELIVDEKHLKENENKIELAESKIKDSETTLDFSRSELDEIKEHKHTINEKQAKRRAEITRIQAQIGVIDQAERTLTGYASGAKTLLDAARQNKIGASLGTLNDHLEIPKELEVSISAALRDYSDAVFLDEGADFEKALDIIQLDSGRVALLPLDNLNPQIPISTPPQMDGCLGVASELLSASKKVRPVLNLLLGQVLVVRTRSDALAALTDQGPHVRAVTLNGEVFYKDGKIFVDTSGGSGILARPRRRREFENEKQNAEVDLKQLEQQSNQLEKQYLDKQNDLEKLTQTLRDLRNSFEENQTLLRNASMEVEQARRQHDWQVAQQANNASEIMRAASEIQTIDEEKLRLANELASSEGILKERVQALTGISLDEHNSQVRHWETEVAVSQRAMQDANIRKHERQQSLDKAKEESSILETRLQLIIKQIQELDVDTESSRGVEDETGSEILSLQSLIQPSEEELRILENDLDNFRQEESIARQVINKAERHHTQAQIALGRDQEALETLRKRIEDDFGLVEFEYDESVSGPKPLPLGDLVEQLPVLDELGPDIEKTLTRQRAQLRRMGSINPEAKLELKEVKQRYEFLESQIEDLTAAEKDIRDIIAELDELMEREFRKTYDRVAGEFREIFTRLFGGGSARLVLTDDTAFSETGIEIETRLPGKHAQRLALLSGGERSLTAAALVFALLKASPTPFCVMDEVDAMLDEANIGRFSSLLTELSKETQFVVITHNRNTVQVADVIYGITMGRDTTSQVVSLKPGEIEESLSR
ncbi:MAG: chromosome segregation protein SMC [Chloroflexi bacterium]|nr:chromosome segregation protein SMC [Chloroflexota bacterium]